MSEDDFIHEITDACMKECLEACEDRVSFIEDFFDELCSTLEEDIDKLCEDLYEKECSEGDEVCDYIADACEELVDYLVSRCREFSDSKADTYFEHCSLACEEECSAKGGEEE